MEQLNNQEIEAFPGLNGKKIILTGACGGIGQAMVQLLSRSGASVGALDLREPSPEQRVTSSKVTYHQVDVTSDSSTASVFELLLKKSPQCDTLICTVGRAVAETFDDLDMSIWHREMELNLNSVYRCISQVINHFKQQKTSQIVVVSSVNAYTYYGNPAYSAAKAGLNNLVKSVASEFGEAGVRCNAICPGSVYTAAWDHRMDKDPNILEKIKQHYPMNQIVNPLEVAYTAAFLVSHFSSGITGVNLPVDCGLQATNFSMVRNISR